ncbi:MAG TPA: hypothetical protein VGN78_11470 [Solirubrobacteraceae bacterium]|nr:hypothetical protein [Solirubrobacteraceae bacterium]
MLRRVGLRPSRRDITLEIDQFTFLPVTRDTALVRLRGRWHAPAGVTMPAPLLVIDPGRTEHRVAPLDRGFGFPPGGPEAPSAWRTTYLVPLDAFMQQGGFAVRVPGVAVWPLPLPMPERRPDECTAEPTQVEVDVLNARLHELDAAVASRMDAPADLHAPLDVARGAAHMVGFKLAAQDERLTQLDAELERSLTAARRREDDLTTALATADERASTAETRTALATGDILDLRDRVSALERREANLVLRLSGAHTRALEAESARAAMEAQVVELAAQIEALEREVAEHVRRALDPRANGDAEVAREALEKRAMRLEEQVAELTRQSAGLVGAV